MVSKMSLYIEMWKCTGSNCWWEKMEYYLLSRLGRMEIWQDMSLRFIHYSWGGRRRLQPRLGKQSKWMKLWDSRRKTLGPSLRCRKLVRGYYRGASRKVCRRWLLWGERYEDDRSDGMSHAWGDDAGLYQSMISMARLWDPILVRII